MTNYIHGSLMAAVASTLQLPVSTGAPEPYTHALKAWYCLVECLQNEPASNFAGQHDRLRQALDSDCLQSVQMLQEWWSGAYQDPDLTMANVSQIEAKGSGVASMKPAALQLRNKSQRTPLRVADPRTQKDQVARYNCTMLVLYEHEFGLHPDLTIGTLRSQRSWAARVAYCQFVSHQTLSRILRHVDYTHTNTEHSVVDLNLSAKPMRVETGPPVVSCPWLKVPPTRAQNLPYYLWDRKQRRTVETSKLNGNVQYAAISHTWGRWMVDQPVNVGGVPWRVPQNSKFDCRKLPAYFEALDDESDPIMQREIARQAGIFKAAKHAIAWLHDVPDFKHLSLLLQFAALTALEIAPEAPEKKVRDSKCEEIWHEILTLFMAMRAKESATGLIKATAGPPTTRYYNRIYEPNPWLTSLWTLQEFCLRPDIWLCANDWTFASACDVVPLPLNGILDIYSQYLFRAGSLHSPLAHLKFLAKGVLRNLAASIFRMPDLHTPDYTPAFKELRNFRDATGIGGKPDLTPIDILSIGDRRVCNGRRAQAIMSAVGATEWYDKLPQALHEKDLVRGMYPLPFLQEVQRNWPWQFFAQCNITESITPITGWTAGGGAQAVNRDGPREFRHLGTDNTRGTMLPFSHASSAVFRSFNDVTPVEDYTADESVLTWEMQLSGAVKLGRACVLASSESSLHPVHLPRMSTYFRGFKTEYAEVVEGGTTGHWVTSTLRSGLDNIDLAKWVGTRPFKCHAILVSFSYRPDGEREELTGILIVEYRGELIKLGGFCSTAPVFKHPQPLVLGWEVV
ncbi:hypothetical protein MBLNU13_g06363t2 [Cladosporium sp. NU13]